MTPYSPPVEEQIFVLDTIADIQSLHNSDGLPQISLEEAGLILSQSGMLAADKLAPLNKVGDRVGAKLRGIDVILPDGFDAAYTEYIKGGWGSLEADSAYGGQSLPFTVASCVQEQFAAANMALSLMFTLSQGAINALMAHATDEQKERYLPKLISGEWTATMNLTEPQAGSDLSAIRTCAEPLGDGRYAIRGNKIFITFGEHGLTDNIVHLVLARLPDAPAGTRGISLFLVPKFLSDGSRNDLRCTSLEHKMGLHASPTCGISYGDEGRCIGELVGQEHGGMRAMFSMMNHARISVGIQGVAIAERALQSAAHYARERVQGKRIIEFADVRRMLMIMRATTEAIRAITYFNAAAVDRAHTGDEAAQQLADLLTPVTKAYSSDMGVEVASLGIQVFGGMGFIEDAGMAQFYRDIRIAPIYEGTNGIQALDLVQRKLPIGRWKALFDEIRFFATPEDTLHRALAALERSTEWLLDNPDDAASGASPYLRLFGIVLGGYLLMRQASVARQRLAQNPENILYLEAKIVTASFFCKHILSSAVALEESICAGSELLFALDEGELGCA